MLRIFSIEYIHIHHTCELSVFDILSSVVVCCLWGCITSDDDAVLAVLRFFVLLGVRLGLPFLVLDVTGIEDSFFFVLLLLLRIGVVLLPFMVLGTGVGGLPLFVVLERGVALLFCCLELLFIGVVVLVLILRFLLG